MFSYFGQKDFAGAISLGVGHVLCHVVTRDLSTKKLS